MSGEVPMRRSIILPGAYCIIAGMACVDFARLPPDGLANIGLMLAVFPVTLVDLALRAVLGLTRSPFIPSWLGYLPGPCGIFREQRGCDLGRVVSRRRLAEPASPADANRQSLLSGNGGSRAHQLLERLLRNM